ncbi:DMP19 family protein [Microbulbifer sediminum]|uniref:DMP19 family protein n=1 Tax=Microbulbifer sediminum TaxID=2904250 RepID=UPI001F20A6D4|nr:DUF4375 domain-containing protein [Microbulbifer sediminum]
MILERPIITKSSLEDQDPYSVIGANIDFVNALLRNHVRLDEICLESLKSYYVDYYLAQVNNGGFSQFVYNSNWDNLMIDLILEGLSDMGAFKNLKLFKKSAQIVSSMSGVNFERFLDGEYFGSYLQIGHLNKFDDRFFDLQKTECLIKLNSDWLKSLPSLILIESNERNTYLKRLIDEIPDIEERVLDSKQDEPAYINDIRALCIAANQTLEFVTEDDMRGLDGKKIEANVSLLLEGKINTARHFMTNKGHHYMMAINGKLRLFSGIDEQLVLEIDVQSA